MIISKMRTEIGNKNCNLKRQEIIDHTPSIHHSSKIIATVDIMMKCTVMKNLEDMLRESSTIGLASNSNPSRSFAPTTLFLGDSGIVVAFIVELNSVWRAVVVEPLNDGVDRDVGVVDTNAPVVFVLVVSEDAVVAKCEVVVVVKLAAVLTVDDVVSIAVAAVVVCEFKVEILVDEVEKSVLAVVVLAETSSPSFSSVTLTVTG